MSTVENLEIFTTGTMRAGGLTTAPFSNSNRFTQCPICGDRLYEALGRKFGMCIKRGCRFNFR